MDGREELFHFLLAEDPQLGAFLSPLGPVKFLQLVRVTAEEHRAAQEWNGQEMLNLLRGSPGYVEYLVFVTCYKYLRKRLLICVCNETHHR